MLLVLDNCEHVIEAAAALAVDTLRRRRAGGFWRPAASVTHRGRTRAPSVTAGEPSHSEAAFRCRGCQLPRRLFVERPAATMNEFELTDADAAIVAEICENWTEFRLRSSLQQPASRSPSTTTWSRQSRENGQIGHSTTVRAAEGAGSRRHLASVFQGRRKSNNIHASSGVI